MKLQMKIYIRLEGKAEGRAEGKAEGELEKSIQIARSLLEILDDRTISEKTGLPLKDISKLRLQ